MACRPWRGWGPRVALPVTAPRPHVHAGSHVYIFSLALVNTRMNRYMHADTDSWRHIYRNKHKHTNILDTYVHELTSTYARMNTHARTHVCTMPAHMQAHCCSSRNSSPMSCNGDPTIMHQRWLILNQSWLIAGYTIRTISNNKRRQMIDTFLFRIQYHDKVIGLSLQRHWCLPLSCWSRL